MRRFAAVLAGVMLGSVLALSLAGCGKKGGASGEGAATPDIKAKMQGLKDAPEQKKGMDVKSGQ
jgi:hypothetical protein